MTIDSVIYDKLATVGAAYPLVAPVGATMPCMVYQFISEQPGRHHGGTDITRRRLQVACWAKTYAAAVTLADSVVAALNLNQTNIELITHEDTNDFEDTESDLKRRIVQFYVWD